MTDNIMRIEWEGPITLDQVEELTAPGDVGIYQIYGPHYVYGPYVLLYIGMTKQAFASRIPAHAWKLYERGSEVRVHVGRLVAQPIDQPEERDHLLGLIERLLIYVHGPAYNSSNIKDPQSDPELLALRIFNLKNHGMLLPEGSG